MADFFHGLTRARLRRVKRLVNNALDADDRAAAKAAVTGGVALLYFPGDYYRQAAELLRDNCIDALALKWFRPKRPG